MEIEQHSVQTQRIFKDNTAIYHLSHTRHEMSRHFSSGEARNNIHYDDVDDIGNDIATPLVSTMDDVGELRATHNLDEVPRRGYQHSIEAVQAIQSNELDLQDGIHEPNSANHTKSNDDIRPSVCSPPSKRLKSPMVDVNLTPHSRRRIRSESPRNSSSHDDLHQDEPQNDSVQSSLKMPMNEHHNSGDTDHICLCQPMPKIPRPRNAFILFRQHQHPAVVTQNPGKANPEISKIIGQMWKEAPQETRDLWLKHAEEEKKNHLQRYPEYRYQPKRHGKKASSGSPSNETSICATCGGRTNTFPVLNNPPSPTSARLTSMLNASSSPRLARPSVLRSRPMTSTTHRKKRSSASEVLRNVDPLLHLTGNVHSQKQAASQQPSSSNKRRRTDSTPPPQHSNPTDIDVSESSSEPRTGMSVHTPANPSKDRAQPVNDLKRSPGPSLPYISKKRQKLDADSSRPSLYNLTSVEKLEALKRIVHPLPTSLSSLRGPIIAIEGEDDVAVHRLITSLKDNLTSNFCDSVVVLHPDHLLEDTDEHRTFANYLQLVARWRIETTKISNLIHSHPADRASPTQQPVQMMSPPPSTSFTRNPIIILDRYILSRSNDAAKTLLSISDDLSPHENWQWCASIWRGCIGADMTILIKDDSITPTNNLTQIEAFSGGISVPKTISGRDWEGGMVRRIAFEIGECMRGLRGMEA